VGIGAIFARLEKYLQAAWKSGGFLLFSALLPPRMSAAADSYAEALPFTPNSIKL